MSNDNMDYSKIGYRYDFDKEIWNSINEIVSKGNISNMELIEHFILFLRRQNLAKYLIHYELFKQTMNLPGSIVECGVFKGVSLLTFTKLVEILCPGDSLKKIIGFDTFSGFTSIDEKDGLPDENYGKIEGEWNSGDFLPMLEQIIELTQKDSMIPRFKRVHLVKGDVCDTIPQYVKENPGLRISLLHLDMDLYKPTLVALEHLYPLVVSGGIVILDEYGMDGFPGESMAFDEYFKAKRPVLNKFSYFPTPGGYFVKCE